jgi:hypothetical protein
MLYGLLVPSLQFGLRSVEMGKRGSGNLELGRQVPTPREVGEWGALVMIPGKRLLETRVGGYKRSQKERRRGLTALICVRE